MIVVLQVEKQSSNENILLNTSQDGFVMGLF